MREVLPDDVGGEVDESARDIGATAGEDVPDSVVAVVRALVFGRGD